MDNKEQFHSTVDELVEEGDIDMSDVLSMHEHAKKVKPLFERLMKHGIVAFIYPVEVRHIGWAWENVLEMVDEAQCMFYLLRNVNYFYYRIDNKLIDIVDQEFKKEFGDRYIWNKDINTPIKVTF